MDYNGVLCDICEKSTRWLNDMPETEEYIVIDHRFGYGSKFDTEEHKLVVCCNCYENMPEPWRSKVHRHMRDDYTEDCVGLDTVPPLSASYRAQVISELEYDVRRKAEGVVDLSKIPHEPEDLVALISDLAKSLQELAVAEGHETEE